MSLTVLRDGTPAIDEIGLLPWRLDDLTAAKMYVAFHVGQSIARLPRSDPRMQLPYPPFGREEWPFVTHADGSTTLDVYGWHYTILDERAEWCHAIEDHSNGT